MGFILDRGFQVLFTAYPAARRQLDYGRLDLRAFEPGAIISQAAHRSVLGDPLRSPGDFLPSLLTRIVTAADKVRTLKLVAEVTAKSVDAIMDGPDQTTDCFVRARGFSERFINNFVRPFFGGVWLDDSLCTSAKAFQFDMKMLSEGQTVIPARGMGQITAQIAEELFAQDAIRLHAPVASLVRDRGGRYIGARLESGEEITGEAVVVATSAPEAGRLTGKPMPAGQTGTVNLYYAGSAPLYRGRKLLLHANQKPFLNNMVQVSNVAPEQAPPGQHLVSATALGVYEDSDDALFERGLADLRLIFAGDQAALAALRTYRPLALYRIPYSQFAQPPGVYETLPESDSGEPGLYFAAEFTAASSQNAAMLSGEIAAQLVLKHLGAGNGPM